MERNEEKQDASAPIWRKTGGKNLYFKGIWGSLLQEQPLPKIPVKL